MTTASAPPASPPIFRPALILPTYNNASTLADIVGRCLKLGLPTYVVDDGCTDNTRQILEAFSNDCHLKVLVHTQNRGKAGAIQTGFAAATVDGCTHAVTMDTDGQLAPEQIPDLIAAGRKNPDALILGARDFEIAGYPAQSRLGRRLANFFIFIESGAKVSDSQCGLRLYPLGMINHLKVRSGRYGYETEVITRAAWAHCDVVEVPVSCRYFPADERVSHYEPWLDTFRAIGLHLRLVLRSLSPWPHRRWPIGSHDPRPWWRRLLHWVNPMDLWRQARLERRGAPMAAAVAVGVFIANLPLYGLHAILCLYAARRLKLHPLGVLAGSLAAAPPFAFLLVPSDIEVGHRIIHGTWLHFAQLNPDHVSSWKLLQVYAGEWTLGGLLLGVVMGLVTFGLIVGLVHLVPRRTAAQRTPAPVVPKPSPHGHAAASSKVHRASETVAR
jgi:uncharacterized protein (DUF2062 family)